MLVWCLRTESATSSLRIRLWSCPVALNANYGIQKNDLRPKRLPPTAPFIMPRYLILKGYFSLITLWLCVSGGPRGEHMFLLCIPLHKEVRGWGFNILLVGTSTRQMLNFSWAWAWTFHIKNSISVTSLPFFSHGKPFDLERVFLINISYACFLHYRVSKWTWVINRKRPSVHWNPQVLYRNENAKKPFSVDFLQALVPSNFLFQFGFVHILSLTLCEVIMLMSK